MFFIFFIIYVIFNSALVSLPWSSQAYWDNKDISNLAVVIVPVADVAAFPLSKHIGKAKSDIGKMYQEFSYAPKIGIYSCLRLHQLLFNEIVIVKKELDQ